VIISKNSVERYKSLGERHGRGLNEIVKTVRGHAWKKEDLWGSRVGDKVGVILSIVALVVSQGFGLAIDPGPIDPLGKQKIVLYTTGALAISLFILEINAMARPMSKLIYTIAVITTLCHREQCAMEFFL